MPEELKPCPFCGRKPEIRHNADGFSYVLCANDGCYARTDGCLNDNEAAKAWNCRVQQPNEPLTLKELPCFEPIYVVPLGTAAPEFSTEQSDYLTLLGKAVQAAGAKVRSLERSGDYIIITYCNGSKDRVCIACDSTLAVMAEVIRRLLYGRG